MKKRKQGRKRPEPTVKKREFLEGDQSIATKGGEEIDNWGHRSQRGGACRCPGRGRFFARRVKILEQGGGGGPVGPAKSGFQSALVGSEIKPLLVELL